MLKLFQFGNSVCAQKVRVTLAEKGLEYETQNVDLFKSEQYHPEYLKLNPKGVVPTLMHDGRPVIESTLICEYLDETFPDPPLMPADPYGRTRMRLWSKAVDEGLHEGTTEISFSAMFRERMRNLTEEQREMRFRNIGDPRRRDRFTSTYELGVDSPFVLHAIWWFEKTFKQMEADLSEHGGDWLVDGVYTLADINLMPYAGRMHYLNLLDAWVADKPRVQAWWERAQARPAYRAGIHDRLSGQEIDDMWTYGSRIRDRLAKIRSDYLAGQ